MSDIELRAQYDIAPTGRWGRVRNHSKQWVVGRKDETYQTGQAVDEVRQRVLALLRGSTYGLGTHLFRQAMASRRLLARCGLACGAARLGAPGQVG